MEHDVISWDAPEYYHQNKSSDWFWMLGIITVSIAVLCILFSDLLFAIFILLAGLTTGLYAVRPPKLAHYEIQPKGILSGKIFYSYRDLESFWVDENHPLQRIIIKSKKLLMPHIIVPVPDIHPEDVRYYLSEYLPEVEHQESVAHRFLEMLGL